MPGGDQTGPMGLGPMTGRGLGQCVGAPVPGYAHPFPGRGLGFGRGRGRGRGWGRGWALDPDAPVGYGRPWGRWGYSYGVPTSSNPLPGEQQVEMLKAQAEYLASSLDEIRKRLAELEAAEETES